MVVAQAGAQVGCVEVGKADAAVQAGQGHRIQSAGPGRIAAGGAIELRLLHRELHTHAMARGEVLEEVVLVEGVALLRLLSGLGQGELHALAQELHL